MNFQDLSLDPKIIRALSEAGYVQPTKIQERAIPEILLKHDIRGSAQTGTGKTAAFLLPVLDLLLKSDPKPGIGPQALIIVPTRELAMQIDDQAKKYSKYLERIKSVCVYGGASYVLQGKKLSKPYEILIATPGRLVDYIKQRKIDFSRLEMLVFDEADRMLDMGFQDAVDRIIKVVPKDRQTLLFSATFDKKIQKLSEKLLNNPKDIIIHDDKEKHENIDQTIHYVDDLGHKNRLLEHILNGDNVEYSIVFTATKRHADQLTRELKEKGHRALALHGDMNQSHRTRTIKKLQEGSVTTLVATDVAARGIDVKHVTHVINFDLPQSAEDYVHRIGRTGRAGSQGTALSFAANRDKGLVKRIEEFTGHPIAVKEIEGLEPTSKSKKSDRPRENKGSRNSRPFSSKRSKPAFGKPSRKGRDGGGFERNKRSSTQSREVESFESNNNRSTRFDSPRSQKKPKSFFPNADRSYEIRAFKEGNNRPNRSDSPRSQRRGKPFFPNADRSFEMRGFEEGNNRSNRSDSPRGQRRGKPFFPKANKPFQGRSAKKRFAKKKV